MPGGLEERLRRAFEGLPGSTPDAEARARRSSLDALEPPTRRRRRRLLVPAAAAAALLVAGAAALAATGTLSVRLGAEAERAQAIVPGLHLPTRAHGIAVVADGRLWLTTREGVRIEGLPVSAAALSPHALYVAVGLGRSLVAMAPTQRLAWSRPTDGTVVAAAWAPNGLRIAYVLRAGAARYELRMIEGDGDHDRLVDASTRPVRPSWRSDSLALAYVGGGGHAVVYDLAHESRRVVADRGCGAALAVAFSHKGSRLAVADERGVLLDRGGRTGNCQSDLAPRPAAGLAWLGDEILSAGWSSSQAPYLRRWVLGRRGGLLGGPVACTRVPVAALASMGDAVVVALRNGRVVESRSDSEWGDCPWIRTRPLLQLRAGSFATLDVR